MAHNSNSSTQRHGVTQSFTEKFISRSEVTKFISLRSFEKFQDEARSKTQIVCSLMSLINF